MDGRDTASGDVEELFDSWAREGVADDAAERHRWTAGQVLEEMDLGPDVRFVDLGTGNGWACREAGRRGAAAVGVDLSPGMLAAAQRRGGADYLRATFDRLPFRDGSVDVVFSMEAIYYAPDLEAALADVTRVLVPGGRHDAVVDYYEENEASHGWPQECGVPMHLLSEAEWADAFRRSGLVDVRTERVRVPDADGWRAEVGSLHVTGRRSRSQT